MEFDPARYDREVIGPLRGRRGRLPDGDLRVRYAVAPGMDRAALEQRLRKVRTYEKQNEGRKGVLGDIEKRLK